MINPKSLNVRIASGLHKHSTVTLMLAVIITVLLSLPMTMMDKDKQASLNPSGLVFDLDKDVKEKLANPIHGIAFIVEARDGDVLTQPVLWELYKNSQAILQADTAGELGPENLISQPYLYSAFDRTLNRQVVGIQGSIPEAVQEVLTHHPMLNTSLENASNEQVKLAIHYLFSNIDTEILSTFVAKPQSNEIELNGTKIKHWTAPVLLFTVIADNNKFGGGNAIIGMPGGSTLKNKEQFGRNVQEILRGAELNYQLWGIAMDVTLEAEDEGQTAGFFIMLTVIAAILIVGIFLKSYWAMALTGVGLGILIIWLKGISALVGIHGGLVIDLIVPIAMISLGVDFAVHAIHRYQEEKKFGYSPSKAFKIGMAGIIFALTLAMLSDGIAFLANVSAGIEAVIHFGLAAAIAVFSSFVVLGIMVPLALTRIDEICNYKTQALSRVKQVAVLIASCLVAILCGTSIILMVALNPVYGMLVLVGTICVSLILPLIFFSKISSRNKTQDADNTLASVNYLDTLLTKPIEALVLTLAKLAPLVIVIAVIVTAISVWLALKLEPSFDVKDFFDNQSDFVVSIDKFDHYVGDRAGEPGKVYIKGDLTDPDALASIEAFIDKLPTNPHIARNRDGEVFTGNHALSMVKNVMESEFARQTISSSTGVPLEDKDNDGIPDSQNQVKAIYDYIYENGLPISSQNMLYDPNQIKTKLFHDSTGKKENVTTITIGIVGSRQLSNVGLAREELADELYSLNNATSISLAGVTGSPFIREGQLNAATRTLYNSMPIAIVGAFLLLLIATRSIRYALVTILPIGIVVAWLYGIMYITGFSLNFVTATIGAISIGVGIDYSIHMTARYREEFKKNPNKMAALQKAANSTGIALVTSAISSIAGFTIMGLAPMPMFASYGQLTALMIFLALSVSLIVLPSLLVLVSPKHPK